MSLTAIAVKAAATAMGAADDAKQPATLHIGQTLAYQKDTGLTTASGGTDVSVLGILYRTAQDQRAELTTQQSHFLIQGADAPSGIDEADTLTIDSAVWQIAMVEKIPTKAVIILTIRK
jgi:hypothetical protein